MRQNMAGAPAGSGGPIGAARSPQVPQTTPPQPQQPPPQQKFSFPQVYNPMTGKPPTSPSHFSPMAGGPLDSKLTVRDPPSNQALLGGVQAQFNSSISSSISQGLFQQFGGSGELDALKFDMKSKIPLGCKNSPFKRLHCPFFSSLGKALLQQEPPFPPEMSPTSPLLSPQNSTSQTPLLQQAPPPGYQSPDTKSWPQTGIASNR